MELCLTDNGVTDKAKIATKIKIAIGKEGLKKLNASTLTEEKKADPDELWKLFEDKLKINVNFRVHRMELMRYKQKADETLDNFVTRCREKAQECDFTEEQLAERVIELVIASTTNPDFQKELTEKPKGYSLENLLTDGQKYEAIQRNKQHLQSLSNVEKDINAMKINKCRNCGLGHRPRRCPAYRDTCKACGITGHWAKLCQKSARKEEHDKDKRYKRNDRSPSRNRGQQRKRSNSHKRRNKGRRTDEIQTEKTESEDDGTLEFYDVHVTIPDICLDAIQRQEVYTTLKVVCPERAGQHHLRLKVDTGSGGNTLPLRTINQMYTSNKWKQIVQPTTHKLKAYNGKPVKCLGTIDIVCKYKSEWSTERFYVVDVPGPVIVGLPTSEKLKLITIHTVDQKPEKINNVNDLKTRYPEQFDKIGSLKGEAKLHLKEGATPSIDAPRKCSIHLKPKLKAALDKMEADKVIQKVTHHTDWCSSITTRVKPNGELRVCLDPKRLNQNLKRCPHKIPTLEEINPDFADAKYFSKLDAKAGYWSVTLSKESRDLTTFRTLFSRYQFLKLPFGLKELRPFFFHFFQSYCDFGTIRIVIFF